MPVLSNLTRIATGYDPDGRLLRSAGALSEALGDISEAYHVKNVTP